MATNPNTPSGPPMTLGNMHELGCRGYRSRCSRVRLADSLPAMGPNRRAQERERAAR